jgi:hypothetical protein
MMDSEGLGMDSDSFSFEVSMSAIEGLGTGPEVSTQDVEAIMAAETGSSSEPFLLNSEPTRVASTEPIFLDSEPTHTGRKRKAKDMSGLTVCFCGERARPGDAGSIQCRKAGCATVWVCYSATSNMFITNAAYSTIFNVLGMRTCNREAGLVSHACVSQARAARARRLGVASKPPPVSAPLLSNLNL